MAVIEAEAALIEVAGSPEFTMGTIEVDEPQGTEVRVAVKASGLCHSDWNIATGAYGSPVPAVLGHEIAGVVESIGPDVREFSVGQHVVACVVASCGICRRCLVGDRVSCLNPSRGKRAKSAHRPRLTFGGQPVYQFAALGGFASVALIAENQLVAVDDAVPFEVGAIMGCSVVTGAGAVLHSAQVQPGQVVAVFGCGGVGLNAIQMAAGVAARRVIAIDIKTEALDFAERVGATDTVNAAAEDVLARLRSITRGEGVDHAFVVTDAPGPLQTGFDCLGARGTVYLLGMQAPGSTFALPVDVGPNPTLLREPGIRAVRLGSTNFKIDIPFLAELYQQGRYQLDALVTRSIALGDINSAYADIHAGGSIARTVIRFD